MAELSERERELVAIGASIGSNCVPCVAYHVGQAREVGLGDEQIEAAIALARKVRAVPASLVVKTARAQLEGHAPVRSVPGAPGPNVGVATSRSSCCGQAETDG